MDVNKPEQYIEVGIGEEKYAVGIQDIHEIIRLRDITELPNREAYFKGVINLRGKIVPVISLRIRFGIMEEPYTKSTRIIVINHAGEMVGIIVDRVEKVTTLSEIQPLDTIGDTDSSCITGFGKTETGLVCILNLEQVLQK
ncbi:chemotaxis protein CheW [Paenibacillus radicis (ex Xue et al. 2023)]|uniref:Chemotaxis protein CheW n=1 Tax=Paenibacillus radicis (ex Xue et al. 2023) TaxID=2972489 RepID=A0ABT1YSN4_9BACL|nr:chemotaxis protein CheW [Paenibacillus radicis (ex Xue et al. 2023)]MCR8636202.1 chemotaxis protein CheW [Paenibacillus radicis (ex Xue et al. 2023)]